MSNTSLVDKLEQVDIDTIHEYHDNPRIGNVEAVADSLRTNKQYKPLVVQEATGEILAGNHTWLAAKSLGWKKISIVRINVSDEEAARIVIVDNRTADLGTYDAGALARVLESIPSIEGTGYDAGSYQLLLESVNVDTPEALAAIDQVVQPQQQVVTRTRDELAAEERRAEATSGGTVGGVARPDLSQPDDEVILQIDDFNSELKGALQLREDMMFDTENRWGFPEYLPDMLVTQDDISDLKTWVSQSLTPDDGHTHYLYTYNLGSSVGIPYDRTVLGFYTYDEKFEQWWMMPANYTSKAINAGIKYMVVPDYSIFPGASADRWIEAGYPPVVNMMNVYRGRWMGRFFQEAGIKIIPNLITSWPEHNDWVKYALHPVGMPVAITEAQTFRPDEEIDQRNYQNKFERIFEYAKPEVLYVYTGNPGREFCERIVDKLKPDTEVRYLDSYSTVKNKHKKQRDAENKMMGKSGIFTSKESRVTEAEVERLKRRNEEGITVQPSTVAPIEQEEDDS